MKKKILLLFIAVFSFLFINEVHAKIVCVYGSSETPIKIVFDGNDKKAYYVDKDGKELPYVNSYQEPLKIDFDVINVKQCPSSIDFVSVNDEMVILDSSKKPSGQMSLIGSTFDKVSCGNVTEIPKKIPELTSFAITMIQIAVPVILVIMGAMDLFKGITAQKEDEIKKGQQLFIKRLIVGALIFFVGVIAKLLISVVADASSTNIIDCVDCFLSNECN